MDANLIYVKTAVGEEAVRQRTRVVQRNTRMVLILVDGQSTVAELCEKAGNAQMVESALQDLERDGLIAPKLEQDSVWEQSRKLAEEIKAAAVNRLGKDLPNEEAVISQAPIIAPQSIEAAGAQPFSVTPLSAAPISTFGTQAPMSIAPPSAFGSPEPEAAPEPVPEPKRAAPKSPGLLAGLLAKVKRDDRDEGIAPIRKGGRGTYISLPLAVALGVVGFVVVLVLSFVLYPYDNRKPQVEAALTRLAGQPIRVAGIQGELTPRPGIVVSGIAGGEGSGIDIARIRLVPELFSLLGSRPVFSSVEVDGARFPAPALASLPKGVATAFAGDASLLVRSLRFSNLTVDVLGLSVAGLQGELRADDKGQLPPLVFTTGDRAFKATLQAQGAGFVADVEALAWQMAAESRFRFNSLQGQVIWDGQRIVVRSLDARIFDGSIQGMLTIDEQAGKPGITGDVTVKHMNVSLLSEALGHGVQYEGEVAGSLRFTGRAASWGEVIATASGEGAFGVNRGVLGGIDLVEAVRRGKSPVRGGSTRYEQLNGNLRITPEAVRFADLSLNSGLLRAAGVAEVAADGKLSGRLDVEMRGTANVVRMPVLLSGSLKDPLVQGSR